MTIIGTVEYQELSGGFWGIIGEDGQQWRPTQMPKALQNNDLKVKITAKKAKAGFSIFMWGTAIDITAYTIL